MSNDQDNQDKRKERLDQLVLGMMSRLINPAHIKDAIDRFAPPPDKDDDKKDG